MNAEDILNESDSDLSSSSHASQASQKEVKSGKVSEKSLPKSKEPS
jgi:hypothetical protein